MGTLLVRTGGWLLLLTSLTACGESQAKAPAHAVEVASACLDARPLFESELHAALDYCRQCHVSGGTADTPGGFAFQLSAERTEDLESLRASLDRLDVERAAGRAKLVDVPTGNHGAPHMGGSPWKDRPKLVGDAKQLIALLKGSTPICP